MRKTATSRLIIFAATLLLSGCGEEKHPLPPAPPGTQNAVLGRVTYQGKLVPTGYVRFIGDGVERTTTIMPGGTYTMLDPPRGLVRITVSSTPPSNLSPVAPPDLGPATLPAKYASPETSELVLEVKGGQQKHDIKLQ